MVFGAEVEKGSEALEKNGRAARERDPPRTGTIAFGCSQTGPAVLAGAQ
jgi:hypothetical protein